MATINVQAGVAAHMLPARPEAAADAVAGDQDGQQGGAAASCAPSSTCSARPMTPSRPSPPRAPRSSRRSPRAPARPGCRPRSPSPATTFPLPAAVDLAAYRIVQESLTNVIRHAGPATAAVSLGYLDRELRRRGDRHRPRPAGRPGRPVSSSASTAVSSAGHGLAGMRERAAAVGGTVEAGPGPVAASGSLARLPTPPRRSPQAPPPPRPNRPNWPNRPNRPSSEPPPPKAHGRDPRPARRRPGADPGRVPRAARRGRGPAGGRRGRRRRSRPSTWPAASAPTWS